MLSQNLKNRKQKSTITFLLVISISSFSILHSPFLESAHADTVSNSNYSIDVDNIDTNPQPTPKKTVQQVLGTSITQSLKSDFTTGPNYTVKESTDSFSLGVAQNAIDLGVLSAANPVIRNSEIFLTNADHGGEILTYQNHPLLAQDKKIIPDTSCDNGACTETTGAPWESNLTYGFGYRCDSVTSQICDQQFNKVDIFKQFPDNSKNEFLQPIIMSHHSSGKTTGTVTYKVTISATQNQEGYYNSITYIAIPNF
ncbi:MAG: hypothetical protein ACR2LN_02835 [Candidatus Levyibacteriota bacterium]